MSLITRQWNILTNLGRVFFKAENQGSTNKSSRRIFEDLMELRGEATVEEVIQPYRKGRVYFQGTWWPARCQQAVTLLPGEKVFVIGHFNITLLVEPLSSGHSSID